MSTEGECEEKRETERSSDGQTQCLCFCAVPSVFLMETKNERCTDAVCEREGEINDAKEVNDNHKAGGGGRCFRLYAFDFIA